MERMARSFALARASWQVLMADKQLAIFTALGAVCTLVVAALFAIPGFALMVANGGSQTTRDRSVSPAGVLLAFAFYVVMSFVTIFFNTALVGTALSRMRGGHATVRDGFDIAAENLGRIVVYALISATVGIVLQVIEERFKLVGQIVGSIAGAAWSIVTFLVIPVMVAEHVSPFDAIKRSGQLLRQTWGEQILGNSGIGIVFFLLSLLAIVPVALGIATQSMWTLGAGIAIAVIYVAVLILVASSLSQIYRVAVYIYADTGAVPSQFEGWMLQDAFRKR
jgi:hypothetical protein